MILIYRRRTTGPVFMATTKNDKTMYVVLVAAIVAGLATTVLSVVGGRPRARLPGDRVALVPLAVLLLSPTIDSMAAAPLAFQIHTLIGMLLFTIWPFTRLVHAFTAPLHYLFRPYIVYRSRDDPPAPGAAPTHRGWAPGRHPRPRPAVTP